MRKPPARIRKIEKIRPIQPIRNADLRKPDAQGRIAIGKQHANETYSVEEQPNGDILLRPVVVLHKSDVPAAAEDAPDTKLDG